MGGVGVGDPKDDPRGRGRPVGARVGEPVVAAGVQRIRLREYAIGSVPMS